MTLSNKGKTNRLLILRLAREYGLALRVAEQARIEKVQSQGLPTNDYDFLMSQEARAIVREEDIILLDYRALQEVWKEVI